MMWEKIPLGDLYTVHNGLSKGRKFFGKGFPFLSFSTVFNNFFLPMELPDLVESSIKEQESYSIKRGDIFITRTSETSDELGMSSVALKDYPLATYNGFTKRMRPLKKNVVWPEYIGYYMRTSSFRAEFNAFSTMTTRASLRNEDLLSIKVALPPLELQKKIASILSAYDDLIENNKKQIKLLEEAAQRLYKEWFVDLRFPGHKNVEIVDGLPEGWSKVQLQELIDFDIGGGWGEEVQSATSEIPAYVIRGTDFEDIINGNFTLLPFRYHKKSNYESRKLQEGDIVFEVSGGSKNEGVARTLLISKELLSSLNDSVICASFCKLVRPKKGFSQYLFDTFRFMRNAHITEQYDKRSASSIVNYRWQDFIVQELISIPDAITLSKYTSLSEIISQAIMSKVREITLAKEARDRLLPKLMSGEIEV